MPRLNQNLLSAVFFLYGKSPKTGELQGPVASGVILGAVGGDARFMHLYAVSSAHTAPKGASVIRINTRDGKSRTIDLEPDQWQFIAGGADVSAVDITDRFDHDKDEFSFIPASWWGGRDFIQHVSLGAGEDGFMLGLFKDHPGKDRNIVAARFGNLSMVASEEAPIKQPNGSVRPSHIFDMRSRGGFSGSPVFVYRTPEGDLREVDFGVRRRTTRAPDVSDFGGRGPMRGISHQLQWQFEHDMENNMFVSLLGIHAGQYPEPVTARKIKRAKSAGEADAILDGDKLEIPGGMTIVVPMWEVYDLLNLGVFVRQRKAREAGGTEGEAIAESVDILEEVGTEAEVEPATDNPFHKEDFTRLLGAAARSSKSAS